MCIWISCRDDNQDDAENFREDFATLAGSIVCESEKLITIGVEVAEACTKETLKRVMTGSLISALLSCIVIATYS